MTRHENAGPAANGTGQKSNQATVSTVASIAHRRLTVLDCACGHVHHVQAAELAELGVDCKPQLVGVAR